MQALAPALDRVYEQQAHSVLRQKVRVVLGDAALAQAEASGSSLREQTKEFRRRLEAAPDGAIPFLQLFNAWRHSPDVLQLLSSPRLASTAAQLLGVDPCGPGPAQRVRLLQDSLFVKRVGDEGSNPNPNLNPKLNPNPNLNPNPLASDPNPNPLASDPNPNPNPKP